MAGENNPGGADGRQDLRVPGTPAVGEVSSSSLKDIGYGMGREGDSTSRSSGIIYSVPIALNAKNHIVFTDRFVHAIGGSNKFVDETPDTIERLDFAYPGKPERTTTGSLANLMKSPGSIPTDQLSSRGGNYVIVVPQEPYHYNPPRRDGTIYTKKCKTVKLRFPSWFRLLTIMWALTNLIKSKDDWPKGFYNWSKRRYYPMPKDPIALNDFSRANLVEE